MMIHMAASTAYFIPGTYYFSDSSSYPGAGAYQNQDDIV
jgi:hypothetical protein